MFWTERYPTTLDQDDTALSDAEQVAAADLQIPGRQPGGGLGGLRMLAGENFPDVVVEVVSKFEFLAPTGILCLCYGFVALDIPSSS